MAVVEVASRNPTKEDKIGLMLTLEAPEGDIRYNAGGDAREPIRIEFPDSAAANIPSASLKILSESTTDNRPFTATLRGPLGRRRLGTFDRGGPDILRWKRPILFPILSGPEPHLSLSSSNPTPVRDVIGLSVTLTRTVSDGGLSAWLPPIERHREMDSDIEDGPLVLTFPLQDALRARLAIVTLSSATKTANFPYDLSIVGPLGTRPVFTFTTDGPTTIGWRRPILRPLKVEAITDPERAVSTRPELRFGKSSRS